MRSCRAVARALAAFAVLFSSPLRAQLDYGHQPPVTHAAVEFAADFDPLEDSEWGFPLGGFGGIRRGEDPGYPPVIFVHGNNVDACDWKLVRDDFRAAGWSDQALWALSYNGLGNDVGNSNVRPDQRCRDEHAQRNGGDSVSRITNNDDNVADLLAFILAVRRYTGSQRFSLVGHSLGVTLARQTLKLYPQLREDLVAFVAIAGANHGTSLCPPGSEQALYSCNELTPGSDWLAALNGEQGQDETYPPARWLSIYEGSGAGDSAYLVPHQQSPALLGADNRQYPGTGHNVLRIEPAIVAEYRQFIEQASEAEESSQLADNNQEDSGVGSMNSGLIGLLLLLISRRAGASRSRCWLFVRLLAALAVMPAAWADEPLPQAAAAAFAEGFEAPLDHEYGFPVGGFGGRSGQAPSHVPVIFVHGNISDACDWLLVRDDFRAAGWNDQALWALSYHALGSNRSQSPARPDPRCSEQRAAFDGRLRITSNEVNVADLAAFIRAVQDYTGSQSFSLVAHSLGVTLARRTLQRHADLADQLVAFVAIAGGNAGTSLCPPGSETIYPGCRELQPGSAWLAELNGPDNSLQSWPEAQWLTIYDGSGQADVAYQGELKDSPRLRGADNRSFAGTGHNDLRVREDIVAEYRQFLEQADARHKARLRRQRYLIGR